MYANIIEYCHGASCLQANDTEGRKNDRLRKEKKRRGMNLTKVDRYLQGKRGVSTTGKFRLVAGNTIRAEARYKYMLNIQFHKNLGSCNTAENFIN